MAPPAIAALALAPFIIWKIVRMLLAYRGDTSDATRSYALKHFTQADIDTGKTHTQPYYLPGLASYALDLVFLWALIFLGLANRIEGMARSITSILPLQVGCFLVIFNAVTIAIFAPLTCYTGYVLGRRLGKLKQTFREWLWFNLKEMGIGFALTWLIFSIFEATVRHAPGLWWLIVGSVLTLFMLLMIFIQPIILAPIFYKFTRLEDGPLRDRLLEICRKAGVAARDVFVQHESKVTTETNAYFTGIGKTKRIVLYDNLLNANSPDEIAVVVAHEAGHWRRRHVLFFICLSVAAAYAGSYLLFRLFQIYAVRQFLGTSVDRLSILPLLSLLGVIVSTFFDPAAAAISRVLERHADRDSLDLTNDPAAFISMDVKLVRSNKTDILPHPLLEKLYASHPGTLERIRYAEERSAEKA